MRGVVERPRVAYQGAPGAFGEEAIARYWGGRAEPLAMQTFVETIAAVRSGAARYGVLPVWNSTIGRIADAWMAIAPPDHARPLAVRIVGEITIPVRHALLCRPGVRHEEITAVMGHPAALAQCDHALAARRYRAIPAEDSASAARALGAADGAEMTVPGSIVRVDPRRTATLAPLAAAARYRLAVLTCAIQNRRDNRTSFLVVDARTDPTS